MNLNQLEEFFKLNKIPAWTVILVYIPLLFLVSQIIIVTNEIPGVTIAISSIFILLVSPFYKRWLFFILFILFNISAVYVSILKYPDINERLIQLFTFDIFLIIAAEVFISMLHSRDEIQKSLQEKTKLLEAIIFFISRSKESKKVLDEVPSVLDKIGKALNVSRVYIFKNGENKKGLYMSQLFEWTDEEIVSQIDNEELQQLYYEYSGYARWKENLEEGRVISGLVSNFPEGEKPLLEEQGIIALLVVPIFAGDKFWGYIGIDECRTIRIWKKEIKEIMKTFADILGSQIYTREVTLNLNEYIENIEKSNKVMVNRELRIIELKNEIKQLKKKLNEFNK